MTALGPRNQRVQHVRRLAQRRRERSEAGEYIVEGPILIADAIDAGTGVATVFIAEDAPDTLAELRAKANDASVECVDVSAPALASMATTTTPRGAVAVVARPDVTLDEVLARSGPVLVLDAVSDPGNLGTLVRTAEASGAAGVVLGPGSVDPYSPKAVRSSAGSILRTPVVEADADLGSLLTMIEASGRRVVGTRMHDADDYYGADLANSALVLGNEAHGVSAELDPSISHWVSIPQQGRAESLNVAMAGTVLCFEALRQRRLVAGANGVHARST